jgi:3-oxoacyl-[acyl-carrier-protein] synthase II
MQRGEIPPCRNLENPDPACPLNFVRNEPLKKRIDIAMKNSFAFGGTNSVVVLKRFR